MVFFPDTSIELWEYGEEGIPDFYGETTASYSFVGVFDVDFQNLSPHDSEEEFGKILEDSYKIYMDTSVPVTDTMIIRRVGEEDTYTIEGSPQHYNSLIPHIKVIVQKQRKPTPLPTNTDG